MGMGYLVWLMSGLCFIVMTSSNGKKIPRYWPFVRGIHRSPVNSPHKGQWRGALMFSLICACINGWVNNWDAGECGITVMLVSFMSGLRFIRLTALMYLILWYVLPLYNNESMDFAIEVTHRIGSSVEHLYTKLNLISLGQVTVRHSVAYCNLPRHWREWLSASRDWF